MEHKNQTEVIYETPKPETGAFKETVHVVICSACNAIQKCVTLDK